MSSKSAHAATRNWFYLCLGTAVTIVLLSWALRDVSLPAVGAALSRTRWEWLLLGWIAYLASYWVRAWRWGTLLAVNNRSGRFSSRLAAIFIGFGANSVLPAYMGELVRAAVLNRRDRVSLEVAIASIFAERLLDIGVVFLFLLLPLWVGALPERSMQGLPLGLIGAALIITWAIFVIGASFPRQIAHRIGQVCGKMGLERFRVRIVSLVSEFLSGLSALRQPGRTLRALVETACIWGLNAITYWAGLVAFGIVAPGVWGALFTQSATALAIAIPSTPGYVGPFEAGIRFALGLYAVPVDLTIAYAIALRFLMYVTIPVIAVVVAARLGFSKNDFTRLSAPSTPATPAQVTEFDRAP